MGRLSLYVERIKDNPRYMVMRGLGRFRVVRSFATACAARMRRGNAGEEPRGDVSDIFGALDIDEVVARLRQNGFATGIVLPSKLCEKIFAFARSADCYAERNPLHGFSVDSLEDAERALRRPILLGQLFNTGESCEAVRKIEQNPTLRSIAARYIGAPPLHVGTLLWWSFPNDADLATQNRAAQMFHYDLDDYAFLKFFFYVTDVDENSGPHVIVRGSHRRKVHRRFIDRFLVRRYSDEEIHAQYGKDAIVSITGPAGSGFAEDTLCIHKGLPPTREKRLVLQIQFALNDYGGQNDLVDPSLLVALNSSSAN